MNRVLSAVVLSAVCLGGCCIPHSLLHHGGGGTKGENMGQIGVAFRYGQVVHPGVPVTETEDRIYGVSDLPGATGPAADFALIVGPANSSPGAGQIVSQDFGPGGTHATWQADSGLVIIWGPHQYVRGRMYRGGGIASTHIVEVVSATKCRVYFAEAPAAGGSLVLTNENPASGSPPTITLTSPCYVEFEVVPEAGVDRLRSTVVAPPFPATVQGFIDLCIAKKNAAAAAD